MPRLTPTDWQTLEKIFEADGFIFDRQKGSHRLYVKPGISRPLTIPKYSEVRVRIIKSNMKTAGMSRKRYFELLSQI